MQLFPNAQSLPMRPFRLQRSNSCNRYQGFEQRMLICWRLYRDANDASNEFRHRNGGRYFESATCVPFCLPASFHVNLNDCESATTRSIIISVRREMLE